jgi:hypothetical protein
MSQRELGPVKMLITLKTQQQQDALMHFRPVVVTQQSPGPHPSAKSRWSEITMTLKRVYPSDYQRVQGAFKDSMIH